MKVISIINLKGGVGKTFTAHNMAYELYKRCNKVLVLDNDKQGNASKALGKYRALGECGAARALTGKYKYALDVITDVQNTGGILDVITGNMSLMTATYQLAAEQGNQLGRYKKLLETTIANGDEALPFPHTIKDWYDYMIIDNPPDIAFNVANALEITDEVIVPVKIDEWALEGLDVIAQQIETAKQINPNIQLLGALVTMYRNDDTNVAGIEWLQKNSPIPLLAKIRYTPKAAESTFFTQPVYEYSPRCGAAQDYKNFVTAYLQAQKGGK